MNDATVISAAEINASHGEALQMNRQFDAWRHSTIRRTKDHAEALAMNAEWDAVELERVGQAQIEAAHGEALQDDAERTAHLLAMHPGDLADMRALGLNPAGTGADQYFRCTATAAECLADGRAGIDVLTDAADTMSDDERDANRYRYVRTLHPVQFAVLCADNIAGKGRFDDLVDAAMECAA